ncbi:serine/threonine protein kinase [Thiosocius teredinicola]|uniref:serine/threonine protein kinase n=1 Tax=Thiosocius teredinicola TaxID=1973002 RepID=UPI0013DE3D3F
MPESTLLNDRFVIGRVLGKPGGFGITYLAWDKVLETAAAIKEFLPLSSVSREAGTISVLPNSDEDAAAFDTGLQVFMKEAKTLAQFSHPNIVRVRDYFPANNTAYLVMDFHRGQSLDEFVKSEQGPLSETLALQIMLPILDGLKEVHAKGFLHRDIKPQNIYLTDKATPMLLDFGAARMALAGVTKTMTVMLSAGFAPFEQYHAKGRQGPWTDVYGVAATLYYMVTGKVPQDAIERQHEDKLLPPIVFNKNLSKRFSQAIMRGLAVEPGNRPQTAMALRNALSGDFHQDGTATVATLAPTVASAAPPRPIAASSPQTVIFDSQPPDTRGGLNRWIALALILAVGLLVWSKWQPDTPQSGDQVARPNMPAKPTTVVRAPSPTPPNPTTETTAQPAPVEHQQRQPAEVAGAPRVSGQPSAPQVLAPPPPVESAPPPSTRPREAATAPPPERLRPTQPAFANQRPRPPQQAFDACRNRSVGSTCKIRSPRGEETGQCESFDTSGVACVPDFHRADGRQPPAARSARF